MAGSRFAAAFSPRADETGFAVTGSFARFLFPAAGIVLTPASAGGFADSFSTSTSAAAGSAVLLSVPLFFPVSIAGAGADTPSACGVGDANWPSREEKLTSAGTTSPGTELLCPARESQGSAAGSDENEFIGKGIRQVPSLGGVARA